MTFQDDPRQDASELTTKPRPTSHRDKRRGLAEIRASVEELEAKVWYDRHGMLMQTRRQGDKQIADDVAERAESAASAIEATYGRANLGPYSDFEWGMLNAKLSALRWVMGEEWDFLDT
jgi:hypothetical protein